MRPQPTARPVVQNRSRVKPRADAPRGRNSAIEQGPFLRRRQDHLLASITPTSSSHSLHTVRRRPRSGKSCSRAALLRRPASRFARRADRCGEILAVFAGGSTANAKTDPFAGRSRNVDPISAPAALLPKPTIRPQWAIVGWPACRTSCLCAAIRKAHRAGRSTIHSHHPGTTSGLKTESSLASEPGVHRFAARLFLRCNAAKDDSSQVVHARPATQPQRLACCPDSIPSWQLPSAPVCRAARAISSSARRPGLTPPTLAASAPANPPALQPPRREQAQGSVGRSQSARTVTSISPKN